MNATLAPVGKPWVIYCINPNGSVIITNANGSQTIKGRFTNHYKWSKSWYFFRRFKYEIKYEETVFIVVFIIFGNRNGYRQPQLLGSVGSIGSIPVNPTGPSTNITEVQFVTTNSSAASLSKISMKFTNNVTSGDLIILSVFINSQSVSITTTDLQTNVYIPIFTNKWASTSFSLEELYTVAGTSGANTISVVYSSPLSYDIAVTENSLIRLQVLHWMYSTVANGTTVSVNQTLTTPNVTTTQNSDLLFQIADVANGTMSSAGVSGWPFTGGSPAFSYYMQTTAGLVNATNITDSSSFGLICNRYHNV